MSPLVLALIAGVAVSLVSLVGFLSLLIAQRLVAYLLRGVVAFAAGGLLGAAFFHLLPESAETTSATFPLALGGLILFFVLDSLLWVYHCHAGHRLHGESHEHGSCPAKPVGILNLVGDAFHNFTDGVVIASAFLVNIPLGIVTSLSVIVHEIPQEMGDFGILLHSGFTKRTALKLNLLVAFTALLGVAGTFVAERYVSSLTTYTIPLAAGGFIYMACTNLLSEIKEEESFKTRAAQFLCFMVGVAVLWISKAFLDV